MASVFALPTLTCRLLTQSFFHFNMLVNCPHCEAEIEVEEATWPRKVDCTVCGSTFQPQPDETVGFVESAPRARIAHFELVSRTGRGSHGTVWKSLDTNLDRTVAIKIPRSDQLTPEEASRFLSEARASARLQHPNIVSVHEAGREDGTVYIVTDYVEGITLADFLSFNRLSTNESVELCIKLADALHHAHEAGVVHRDVKPSNIMLDKDNEPFIMDFGLAKRDQTDATITGEGFVIGTPAYMSPEQAQGNAHDADRRSDVYSLGVVLFHMLTGEKPFRGTEQLVMQQAIDSDAPHPRRLNPSIPKDLDTICLKCLEKPRQKRYQTAGDLRDELTRYLAGEPIHARPITRPDRVWRWCRRNPVISGLSAALLLSLLAGLVGVSTQSYRAQQNETRAVQSALQAQASAGAAKQAQTRTEQYLYIAHMNLAQQAYELTDPDRVVNILNQHRPASSNEVDHRSFEWFFWWRQSHRWSRQLNHTAAIHAAAISADGSTIAAGGADGQILLWDVVSGERRTIVDAHQGPVFTLAFCPSDGQLVSAGRDGIIRFWNPTTATEQNRLETGKSIFCLAFTREGARLVSAGSDLAVSIWDTQKLERLRQLQGHFDFIYAVAISADGQHIASAGLDRTVRIWNAENGQPLHTLHGHVLEVWSLAFSPDGTQLASGSADQSIKLWNVASGNLDTTLIGHTDRVRALVYSPQGDTLASASHDRTINLWDMKAESKPLEVPYRNVNRPGNHFFERMQLPNDDFLKDTLKGHPGRVACLAYASNGKTIVSGDLQGELKLWDVFELQQRSILRQHEATINSLAITPDGRTMISGSNDRTARLWDLTTMRQIGDPIRHDDMVLAVATSPDGSMYATASNDGMVRLGAFAGGIQTWNAHEQAASAVDFSPDSKTLATASHDGTVRIWDIATGNLKLEYDRHEGRVQAVVCLAAPPRIASTGADGTIHIWDPGTGEMQWIYKGHTAAVWSLAVSPDQRQLASTSADKTVRVWELKGQRECRTFRGHAEIVRCVSFCQDGRTLATGSDDKTVKLWDLSTGEPKSTLQGHKYRVWALAFDPAGHPRLYSGSLSIRVWQGADQ